MKKILFATMTLFLLTGFVSAELTVNDFKAPDGLEVMGTHSFIDKQGHNIEILQDSDNAHQTWFENSTEYIVEKYNDTSLLASDNENDCYLIELVELGNTKYIIYSWTTNGPADAQVIKSNLEEFNRLNNLEPLEV